MNIEPAPPFLLTLNLANCPMAVQLVSAEFPSGSVSSKLPVVEIENKDIKAPDYLKGRITGRTSGVFTSDEQQRKIVWESNYKRYVF